MPTGGVCARSVGAANTQARKQIEIQQSELAELRHQLALYASGAKEMPRFEPTAAQPEEDMLMGLEDSAPERPPTVLLKRKLLCAARAHPELVLAALKRGAELV